MRFDHIDLRVRDVRKSFKLYDALFRSLGTTRCQRGQRTVEWYNGAKPEPFFGIHRNLSHVANQSRIAFAADARQDVRRTAAAVKRAGAKNIEGPEVCKSYSQPYYAVFFEDFDGNKFEVCCRW